MGIKTIYESSYEPQYWFDTALKLEGWFDQEYSSAAGGTASVIGAGDIASAEAFGQPTVTSRAAVVGAGDIASAEAFGQPTVTAVGVPATQLPGGGRWREGLPHPPYLGPQYGPLVIPKWVTVRDAGGIASEEAFGRPRVISRRDMRTRRREEELLAA